MDGNELFQRYRALQKSSLVTVPHTNQRILLVRKIWDLEAIITSRGYSLIKFFEFDLKDSIPNLSNKDYQILATLENFSSMASFLTRNASSPLTKYFKNALLHFISSYLRSPLSKKTGYASAL